MVRRRGAHGKTPLAMHQDSSQIKNMLDPVRNGRDALRRAGKTPPNHARDNLLAIKEQSLKNAAKKAQELAEKEARAKGFRVIAPGKKPATSASRTSTPSKTRASPARASPSPPPGAPSSPYETNFVATNRTDLVRRAEDAGRAKLRAEARLAEEARANSPLLKSDYGRVPEYLRQRKLEALAARQRAEAAERSKHIPAGMRILPEDERLKTLEVLEQSKGDVEARLGELPIAATDNQVVQRRKAELEVKLGEIEDALKIFARKTVLVRE